MTPGVTAPNDGDQAIGNVEIKITKARAVPFRWNGEEQRGINNGPGYANIKRDQIVQAMRTLTNEVEADLAGSFASASRAVGTNGSTPFDGGSGGKGLGDSAKLLQVLLDNGAPNADLQMVINTNAGANMRTLTNLTKANEAADSSLLRQGVLLDVHGFAIRESAAVKSPVVGTGVTVSTDSTGYAVGSTSIKLKAAGTGTILAGDVITFAGDTNQYVVAKGAAAVSGATIEIAEPGLQQALPAAEKAVTIVATGARNMGFQRNAIVLVARAPALPDEGDMADDRMVVTDPRSGLSFEVSMYRQYRQVRYELALAWGSKVIKPAHTSILLG